MSTSQQSKIIDQFSRWAKRFGELPVHAEPEAMRRTLAACAPQPAERILDVACGPGILACALAPLAAQVVGLDLTPAMLEEARRRQAAAGLDNLQWRLGEATALPFADGAFDVATTRYSLHHMIAPQAVVAEMARVVRPGGRVVVIDAAPAPDFQAAYDEMERLRDPSHVSALTLEALRALGPACGLVETAVASYRLEARLADLAEAADLPALEAMFARDVDGDGPGLGFGLGAFQGEDGLRFYFPISILVFAKPAAID